MQTAISDPPTEHTKVTQTYVYPLVLLKGIAHFSMRECANTNNISSIDDLGRLHDLKFHNNMRRHRGQHQL